MFAKQMFAQLRTGLICLEIQFMLLVLQLYLWRGAGGAPEVLFVSVPQLKAHTLRFNQY